MSDYIKREDALEAIVDERTHTILQAWINVKKTVPSIDAVEVVRCKECRHWSGCKSTMHNNHLCSRAENADYLTGADDYCSFGERKEGK